MSNPFVEALDRAEKMIAEQYRKLTEVAAFLDGLANKLDVIASEDALIGADDCSIIDDVDRAATDCRAMAKKLRGEP